MLGKIEGSRGRGRWRMRRLNGITNLMDMSLSKMDRKPGVLQSMELQRVRHDEQLNNSRQEYWNGLPCPPPGDLPNPGIELGLNPTWHADSLPAELPGKPLGLLLHDNM